MKPIDQDSVPSDFDSAVHALVALMDDNDREQIKEMESHEVHMGLGQYIRNNWSLWEKDSPLVQDFKRRFHLFGHADDVSGLLFHCVWREVAGRPWEAEAKSKYYRKHWIKENVNPETGEDLDEDTE